MNIRFYMPLLSFILLFSCQDSEREEKLERHTINVNKGLEELIAYWSTNLNMIALETGKLDEQKKDLNFYYKNTYALIDENNEETKSILYWRLTKSNESNKYKFHPDLDSTLMFSQDSLLRKTALLINLHEYITHISRSISFCKIIYGSTPVVDSKNSSMIHFYGIPPKGSEFDRLIAFTKQENPSDPDTTQLWATLKIHNLQ